MKRRRGDVAGKGKENGKEGGESLESVVVDVVVAFEESTKEKNIEDLPLPFAHPFHVVVDVEEGIQIPDDRIVAYAP